MVVSFKSLGLSALPSSKVLMSAIAGRNVARRYNAAPSQELLVIRQNHKTGERSLDLIKWGLIAYWCKDPKRWKEPHQRKGRERLKAAHVQGRLRSATLHRAGRWLLRVARHQGRMGSSK